MPRIRHHREEHARRRALARQRGLSPSQAEGHPRKGEPSISELKSKGLLSKERPETLDRLYNVASDIVQGKSVDRAAKDVGIAPSTVRRLGQKYGLLGKRSGVNEEGQRIAFAGWDVYRQAQFPILEANGSFHKQVDLDTLNASLVGSYWHAVRMAREHQDNPALVRELQQFRYATVRDINGQSYTLETDLNRLYRRFSTMSREERDEVQRLFGSERVPVRHGR